MQYVSTIRPGFIWDARMRMAPLIDARVIDMYKRGSGTLLAKLAGVVTVANAAATKELDTGELMRYLAEAVWFPTTLLPGPNLKWEPVGLGSAIAILTDSNYEVRLRFYFNDRGEIVRSTGERYLGTDGTYKKLKWTGSYSDYQLRNGVLVPLQGSVSWMLPEGEWNYWKGRIVQIRYKP